MPQAAQAKAALEEGAEQAHPLSQLALPGGSCTPLWIWDGQQLPHSMAACCAELPCTPRSLHFGPLQRADLKTQGHSASSAAPQQSKLQTQLNVRPSPSLPLQL